MKNHYTYRITNIKTKRHYYGVRSTDINPIDDIGFIYFSSSADSSFKEDQKNNKQDYKYKVISIFDNRKEAAEMEVRLHERFDVGANENFYNRSKSTSTSWSVAGTKQSAEHKLKRSNVMKGKVQSFEHIEKRKQSLIGLKQSEESLKKRSISMQGKNTFKRTEETKNKMSKSHAGKTLSQEHKDKLSKNNGKYWLGKKRGSLSKETLDKMSAARKGIKQPLVKCPHCSKEGGTSSMTRYHFDNCKILY